MLWVSLNLLPGNNSTQGSVEDLNRLGGSIGALGQSPSDAGPDVGPSASDKKTAALYGKRIAEAAVRWTK
jgi:NAD(P)H dehydrogenase (quinone)